MLSRIRPDAPGRGAPRGVALIITITVLAVLTSLAATVVVLSVNNIQNTGRDKQSSGALDLAEAGVTQGLAYIRSQGVNKIICKETDVIPATTPPAPPTQSPECTAAGTLDWTNSSAPHLITIAANQTVKVWISLRSMPTPPQVKFGTYRIHAIGDSGRKGLNSGGHREVFEDIQAQPVQFPLGLYADAIVGAGNPTTYHESIFSANCLQGRSHFTLQPPPPAAPYIDPAYGIPAGAHAVAGITNGVNTACSPSTSIHSASPCDPTNPYDQDGYGGDLAGTVCQGAGGVYPQNSSFTAADLAGYGYQPGGLTNSAYAALKQKAISQGNYYNGTTSWTLPDPNVYPNAVVYFDLANTPAAGTTVFVQSTPGYEGFSANGASPQYCGTRSILFVVRGGGVHTNAQLNMVGGFFLPEGTYQGNGGAHITGTVFAKDFNKVNGAAAFFMDPCFLSNIPGGLVDIKTVSFQEVEDR